MKGQRWDGRLRSDSGKQEALLLACGHALPASPQGLEHCCAQVEFHRDLNNAAPKQCSLGRTAATPVSG